MRVEVVWGGGGGGRGREGVGRGAGPADWEDGGGEGERVGNDERRARGRLERAKVFFVEDLVVAARRT